MIHANVPKKLIAIATPPGYGKTTLLADFTSNTELPVCWVRLTDADRDVMRLATIIAASLQKRFRRLRGEPNLEVLADASPEALARAFSVLIDERVSETFVIALDDVHLINRSKPVLEFLDAWLTVQPEQVTLIAAGREVLEVSLARLMADGDLAGMGPHDLALTREELTKLSKMQLGIELDDNEADRLLEETRGWVTGVLLSGMLSRNVMSALAQATGPMVYEYLASVVLNRQPEDMRRFLLESAVLPVMTAASCDEVLQRESSHRFLSKLVKEGYFVTASGESPRMYEYHPQFRDFLLEVLSDVENEKLRKLRLRAAKYFSDHGTPEHAVELYFDAKAASNASRLAEKHANHLFRTGQTQTLHDWARKLEESGTPAPKVFFYLSAALTNKGEIEEAEETLKKARMSLRSDSAKGLRAKIECQQGFIALRKQDYSGLMKAAKTAKDELPSRPDRLTNSTCLRLQALALAYSRQNYREAEEVVTKAVKLLEATNDNYDLAMALIDLSMFQAQQGNALGAHGTDLKVHDILESIGAPLPLATSFNNLAIDAHFQGRFEEALKLFNLGMRHARQAGSSYWEALILFGQADLFSDLGLPLQAAELYGQGLRVATQLDNRGLIRYGCIQTSVLHRRRGSGDLPHQWLKRAMALGGDAIETPDIQIQVAALEMGTSPSRAQEVLGDLVSNAKVRLDANQQTLALYFIARSYCIEDRLDELQKTLRELMAWSGGNGTEQLVAAELAADDAFREFCKLSLVGDSTMTMILHRVDTLRALAQQYQDVRDETVAAPRIVFTTLGKVEISRGLDRLTDLKPLAREILIYLIDNKRVDRDVLLETFWPHYPPGRQVSNLYTAIYSLRRALGKDAVTLEGSVYGIDDELAVEYDVARFERAASVAEGLPPGDPRRFFALTEAINSYGGTFLPEITTDWVVDRRRMLELRFLEMLIAHADEALVRNQPLKALSSLRSALSINPYRDDINLRYLETLGLLERRSEIVAHYRQYIQLLSTELGLDPPESVRILYTRLIG